MGALEFLGWFFFLLALVLCCLAVLFFVLSFIRRRRAPLALERLPHNPVLAPVESHWWESQAVFNPAAIVHGGRVHLFYRAMGHDGISRIGHASSADGIHFERTPYPVYDQRPIFTPPKGLSYATLTYNTDTFASGGGWGGVEDPRAVMLEGDVYMTFGIFEGWQSMRLGVTRLPAEKLDAALFSWTPYIPMSPKGQTNKNWVLFPEKIRGHFAILHALTPRVMIEYVDDLEDLRLEPIQSNNHRTGRKGHWDALIRGAGAPPIKTKEGWLLLYHGMDPDKGTGYQVGAMLLDLEDPSIILYQSDAPILSASEWYENDWKPGVVYATGAVVLGNELFVYYGGGDKYVAAATAKLDELLRKLMHHQNATLTPVTI